MFRFLVLSSLVAVALGAAVPKGMVPKLDGRIVGGHDTEIEDAPWQVSMKYYGSHRCGGSVTAGNIIISAAHCVDGVSAGTLEILAGTALEVGPGGQTRKVQKVIGHPKYNPSTIDFDIAILILASPFEFSSKIQPVAMPEQNEEVSAGSKATITGWGALREGGSSPNQLQSVSVTVVTNGECQKAYSSMNDVTTNMMCAGEPEGGRDSCQGDSGGPVIVDNKLVGVVSWGYGCARKGYPGVYARVASMRKWVDENSE